MSKLDNYVDPLECPLCQKKNACANLDAADAEKTCWCNDPNAQFPKSLLDQVDKNKQGKACICKQCAESFAKPSI